VTKFFIIFKKSSTQEGKLKVNDFQTIIQYIDSEIASLEKKINYFEKRIKKKQKD
jgi:exonuclease VII small subunit